MSGHTLCNCHSVSGLSLNSLRSFLNIQQALSSVAVWTYSILQDWDFCIIVDEIVRFPCFLTPAHRILSHSCRAYHLIRIARKPLSSFLELLMYIELSSETSLNSSHIHRQPSDLYFFHPLETLLFVWAQSFFLLCYGYFSHLEYCNEYEVCLIFVVVVT